MATTVTVPAALESAWKAHKAIANDGMTLEDFVIESARNGVMSMFRQHGKRLPRKVGVELGVMKEAKPRKPKPTGKEVHPSEAEAARLAFNYRAAKINFKGIAYLLNTTDNLRTRDGEEWTHKQVRRLLAEFAAENEYLQKEERYRAAVQPDE